MERPAFKQQATTTPVTIWSQAEVTADQNPILPVPSEANKAPIVNGPHFVPLLAEMDRLSNSSAAEIQQQHTQSDKRKPSEPVYIRKAGGARSFLSQVINRLRGRRTHRRPFQGSCENTLVGARGPSRSRSPGGSQHDRRFSTGNKRRVLQHINSNNLEVTGSFSSSDRKGCRWTFVFDPSGRLAYYWSCIVSIAFLYNLWVILYRFSFQEIDRTTVAIWMPIDYCADLLYILDILFNFRTGFLEDGVLQTEPTKLRQHYINSTQFYIDCLCLLPLDFLYLSLGFNSALRSFRLVKIYRFWNFLDRTERHTNYPNIFRSGVLIHYLLVLFHWNACIYYLLSSHFEFRGDWAKIEDQTDIVRHYLYSLYWSTLFLTNIGDIPRPMTRVEYIFVILELICGMLLFAAVLGHVANIVTNVSAARKEFQGKLDNVKTYMNLRRVPDHLQKKVIKWFDYLWLTKKSSDDEKTVMSCLPDKLKAEIAIHVHLDTLKRVEIFQNTEAGFLCELVLRLRPVLFSPGDYICRKGEVGKEMYIVARGKLQVVADNGRTVLATLRAGSYFGEISILNMGTLGNRRTASVRSVGYSDLFCLSKQDMWDVLQEYPAARVRLEGIAQKRLRKYEKSPLEKATTFMNRSHSTPGLIEPGAQENCQGDRMAQLPSMPSGLYRVSHSSPAVETAGEERDDHRSQNELVIPVLQAPSQRNARSKDQLMTSSREGAGYHSPQPPFFSTSQHHLSNHLLTVPHVVRRSTTPSAAALTVDETHICQSPSSSEELMAEIKRLRERLVQLETENASMSIKLNQQQWEVEHRLAEIEMHICGSESPSGSDFSELTLSNLPKLEKPNRESII